MKTIAPQHPIGGLCRERDKCQFQDNRKVLMMQSFGQPTTICYAGTHPNGQCPCVTFEAEIYVPIKPTDMDQVCMRTLRETYYCFWPCCNQLQTGVMACYLSCRPRYTQQTQTIITSEGPVSTVEQHHQTHLFVVTTSIPT